MTERNETVPAVLEARDLWKRFGSVTALENVCFRVNPGEVVGLIGDNGAGKSTLIKVLSGVLQPDAGEVWHHGQEVVLESPSKARARGIETIYQDLALVDSLDIASNMYLGRERRYRNILGWLGVVDEGAMGAEAQQYLDDLGISLPSVLRLPASRLSGGQRQAVAVARAAVWAGDVLMMDEPTAALGVRQANAVLTLAKRVADRGIGVVLISHTLPHVLAVADRIVVLRHGRTVADLPRRDAAPDLLVALIVGTEEGAGDSNDDPKGIVI